MKVILKSKDVDTWLTDGLEIGNIYEVIVEAQGKSGEIYYTIKTKLGSQGWLSSRLFDRIDEIRDRKIDIICG